MNLVQKIEVAFDHRKMPSKVHVNEKNALVRLRTEGDYEHLSDVEFATLSVDYRNFNWVASTLTSFEFDSLFFRNRDWRELTCADFSEYKDAVNGFTAEAFCYFLPGIMSASIRESSILNKSHVLPIRSILSVINSLDMMLFNYSVKDTWSIKRFILLTPAECATVQEWLLWLAKQENDPDTYMKSYGNLEWLIREYDSKAFKELRALTEAESQQ